MFGLFCVVLFLGGGVWGWFLEGFVFSGVWGWFLEGFVFSGVWLLMCSAEFSAEVVSFISSLGLSELEGSGLRLPPGEWDWELCCHACVWLAAMGHILPGNLSSRMLLGPENPSVRIYCELLRLRELAQNSGISK